MVTKENEESTLLNVSEPELKTTRLYKIGSIAWMWSEVLGRDINLESVYQKLSWKVEPFRLCTFDEGSLSKDTCQL